MVNVNPIKNEFIVDLKGFDGPLELLLSLAQKQKVDLKEISITELVDQYLLFLKTASKLKLELAAEYLMMASFLTYLKSRILLPKEIASLATYWLSDESGPVSGQVIDLEQYPMIGRNISKDPLNLT